MKHKIEIRLETEDGFQFVASADSDMFKDMVNHDISPIEELYSQALEAIEHQRDVHKLNRLTEEVVFQLRWDYNAWKIINNNGTQSAWNQTLMSRINELTDNMAKYVYDNSKDYADFKEKNKEFDDMVLIVSPETATVLESLEYFDTKRAVLPVGHSYTIGYLGSKYRVVKNVYMAAPKILVSTKKTFDLGKVEEDFTTGMIFVDNILSAENAKNQAVKN